MVDSDSTADQRERLQKLLARAGLGSRRSCEQLIESGRVTVNGAVAVLGTRADPRRDRVALDGIPVPVDPISVSYILHKPAGVVTTASDPHGRVTVTSFVPSEPRVFPVGRLDMDTEGLIILTNDGELANRIAHPSHGVPKTYLAHVHGRPTRKALAHLRRGVELDDGITAPARARVVAQTSKHCALEITVHEGRNRQVRRMCDAIGHPVVRLVRTRIGPVADAALGAGDWRPLTLDEVRALYEASGERSASLG